MKSMKAYLVTTGSIFAVLTGLHIWRAFAEKALDPMMILMGLLAAGLCIWAFGLLRNLSRS